MRVRGSFRPAHSCKTPQRPAACCVNQHSKKSQSQHTGWLSTTFVERDPPPWLVCSSSVFGWPTSLCSMAASSSRSRSRKSRDSPRFPTTLSTVLEGTRNPGTENLEKCCIAVSHANLGSEASWRLMKKRERRIWQRLCGITVSMFGGNTTREKLTWIRLILNRAVESIEAMNPYCKIDLYMEVKTQTFASLTMILKMFKDRTALESIWWTWIWTLYFKSVCSQEIKAF